MVTERTNEADPRIQEALDKLRSLIRGRYPAAIFEVYEGEDPDGVYLDAVVDVEDTDEVMDLIIDRLLELQIDEGLPVYVIPLRPLKREVKELRAEQAAGGLLTEP